MTLKSGEKFEEKLIFGFKNDKNLVNFNPSNKKSKKFALWPKEEHRGYILWHWRVMQNLKKDWLVVLNIT